MFYVHIHMCIKKKDFEINIWYMEMRLVKISMDVVFLQNFEIPQIDLFVQREFIFNIFSLKSRKKK